MKKTIGKFLMLTAIAGTISSGFAMKKVEDMNETERLVTFGTNAIAYQALFFNPTYQNKDTKKEDPTTIMQMIVDRFNQNKILKELEDLDISLNTTAKDEFFSILDSTVDNTQVAPEMIADIKAATEDFIAGNTDGVDLKKLTFGTFLNDSVLKSDDFSNDVASSLFGIFGTKEKMALLESQMNEIEARAGKIVKEDLNTIAASLFNSSKPLVEEKILKVFGEYKTAKEAEVASLREELSAKKTQVVEAPKPVYQSRYNKSEREPSASKLTQSQQISSSGYVSKYAKREEVKPEPVRQELSTSKPTVTQPTTGYVSKYAKKEEVKPEPVRQEQSTSKHTVTQPTTGYVSKYARK